MDSKSCNFSNLLGIVMDCLKKARSSIELPAAHIPQQIAKLGKILDRPPIVELETVNVCNSKCRFCISRLQTVRKKIIDEKLFEDVARQISEKGTGQLCLVPMLGDPLLDDNIVAHAEASRNIGNTGEIRFITNGLALDRYSDEELISLFASLDKLEISIGPNAYVYRNMFGVDRFEHLVAQLYRVCALIDRMPERLKNIALCGRACGEEFWVDPRLVDIAKCLTGKTRVNWTREYMDWGGQIDDLPLSTTVIKMNLLGTSISPCFYSMAPHIYQDGSVGLCACAGASAELLIGDLRMQSWLDILRSERRLEMILSFFYGQMPKYCQKCSFYIPSKTIDWRSLLTLSGEYVSNTDNAEQNKAEAETVTIW